MNLKSGDRIEVDCRPEIKMLPVIIDPRVTVDQIRLMNGDQIAGVIVNIDKLNPQIQLKINRTWKIELFGSVPAKKNQYTPKRKGGMFKDDVLQSELDNLEQQIPGDVRDLRLLHPDIKFQIWVKNGRRDRDGIVTTLLDLLVRCGVLVDDCVNRCNGTIIIPPAEIGEDKVVITIMEAV